MRARGMSDRRWRRMWCSRVRKGEDGSPSEPLFERGSQRQLAVLAELREQLLAAGFYCESARASEDTLRVYPVRRHELPLLNPRYVSRDGKPTLEIAVLSKGIPGLATRLLGFRATSQCRFEHVAAMEGEYRRHGRFVVEITMKGNSPQVPTHALQSIHQCLTAPRRPATE